MKGYRFYKEIDTGNVIALKVNETGSCVSTETLPLNYGMAVRSTNDQPNAPCATLEINLEILGTECIRIREDQARKAHPRLFAYLDDDSLHGDEDPVW